MNKEANGRAPVERRVVHLLPCKNCGDSDPNNALFGARPEFSPGVSLGLYVHCKACGELSKADGDSYEQFISAWNKRHNAEVSGRR
jgi:hypothetical protein